MYKKGPEHEVLDLFLFPFLKTPFGPGTSSAEPVSVRARIFSHLNIVNGAVNVECSFYDTRARNPSCHVL
jgi:hypothetical protein